MPQIAAADDTKLHVAEAGSGSPVVFVHEYGGDYRTLEQQMRHFSRQHRCVIYGQRGYPPSDAPADPARYSQEIARDDVIAVMAALGIERAHVVGHSIGAHGPARGQDISRALPLGRGRRLRLGLHALAKLFAAAEAGRWLRTRVRAQA
jgi:pimeloyl-ACP methyl ester carboxylesterase